MRSLEFDEVGMVFGGVSTTEEHRGDIPAPDEHIVVTASRIRGSVSVRAMSPGDLQRTQSARALETLAGFSAGGAVTGAIAGAVKGAASCGVFVHPAAIAACIGANALGGAALGAAGGTIVGVMRI